MSLFCGQVASLGDAAGGSPKAFCPGSKSGTIQIYIYIYILGKPGGA